MHPHASKLPPSATKMTSAEPVEWTCSKCGKVVNGSVAYNEHALLQLSLEQQEAFKATEREAFQKYIDTSCPDHR